MTRMKLVLRPHASVELARLLLDFAMHPGKHRISLLLLTAAFIGLPGMASAMPMVDVAKVLDGDTVEVLDRTRTMRIRLHGIDCPEKGQP